METKNISKKLIAKYLFIFRVSLKFHFNNKIKLKTIKTTNPVNDCNKNKKPIRY